MPTIYKIIKSPEFIACINLNKAGHIIDSSCLLNKMLRYFYFFIEKEREASL